MAINDYGVEQQLFKAYIRTLRFEKVDSRDATYVMVQYDDGNEKVCGFGRVNNFFLYDGIEAASTKVRMLVNIDIIKTTAVNVAPGIAPGRPTRGRGVGWPHSEGSGRGGWRGWGRGVISSPIPPPAAGR